jgi:hypothetical protein
MTMVEQVVQNKSSLLQKVILQTTQTLQLFATILKQEVLTKVIKKPSWKAWVQRPSGIIKKKEG